MLFAYKMPEQNVIEKEKKIKKKPKENGRDSRVSGYLTQILSQ
jgi:hypothetical protein